MKKIVLLFSALTTHNGWATVSELQPLDFGQLAIGSNHQVSSVTLTPGNTSTSTHDIYILKQGRAAELLLEGYPARRQISISDFVTNQAVSNIYGGNSFVLEKLIYSNSAVTDSYGNAILRIGGKLNTTGGGGTYFDGKFDTTVEITIDF